MISDKHVFGFPGEKALGLLNIDMVLSPTKLHHDGKHIITRGERRRHRAPDGSDVGGGGGPRRTRVCALIEANIAHQSSRK